MLDRLKHLVPGWEGRHAADLGVMLAELFAHVGDQLSYQQDAVATEAYLGTARRRVSVRRHARLVDYRLHDGCNARAWVVVSVSTPREDIARADIWFVTRIPRLEPRTVRSNLPELIAADRRRPRRSLRAVARPHALVGAQRHAALRVGRQALSPAPRRDARDARWSLPGLESRRRPDLRRNRRRSLASACGSSDQRSRHSERRPADRPAHGKRDHRDRLVRRRRPARVRSTFQTASRSFTATSCSSTTDDRRDRATTLSRSA